MFPTIFKNGPEVTNDNLADPFNDGWFSVPTSFEAMSVSAFDFPSAAGFMLMPHLVPLATGGWWPEARFLLPSSPGNPGMSSVSVLLLVTLKLWLF